MISGVVLFVSSSSTTLPEGGAADLGTENRKLKVKAGVYLNF